MDGFYKAETAGALPFGHFNGSTIPGYWDYAEEYGLGDNFFSSALSYSLPNHWYIVAGAAPPVTEKFGVQSANGIPLTPKQVLYLNQANATPTSFSPMSS